MTKTSTRIVTSRDENVVRRWAKKTGRTVLWRDDKMVWHAAIDTNNVPTHSVMRFVR